MANFTVSNSTTPAGTAQVATGSSYTAMIAVAAGISSNYTQPGSLISGLRRGKLYDIIIGTNTAPADTYLEFEVARVTMGTTVVYLGSVSSVSTAYTNDPADPGFGAIVTINGSAGSSAVISRLAQPWYLGVNQRASYRWVAAPGSELVYPANSSGTGNNGLALQNRAGAYTGTVTGTIMVSEM